MSLVPDYENSESSENSDDDRDEVVLISEKEKLPELPRPKLPPPSFIGNSSNTDDFPKTSVFKNPYIEAEIAKDAILEKHVKMVETTDKVAVINGKKICWNYRKGRCRFGHNCKYAHDSDLQKSQDQLQQERQIQQTVLFQNQNIPQPTLEELAKIKGESIQSQNKRKRPGLTQGLVPGKKVMKNYLSQKT